MIIQNRERKQIIIEEGDRLGYEKKVEKRDQKKDEKRMEKRDEKKEEKRDDKREEKREEKRDEKREEQRAKKKDKNFKKKKLKKHEKDEDGEKDKSDNSKQKDTGKTPFEMIHGYNSSYTDGIVRAIADIEEWENPEEIQKTIRETVTRKQEVMKKNYDKRRSRRRGRRDDYKYKYREARDWKFTWLTEYPARTRKV